jgi:hypothetical protein
LNHGSQWKLVALIAVAVTWLISNEPAVAMERATQAAQITSHASLEPRDEVGRGPLRPYGTDRINRLARARFTETVLVVAVGAAAAVVGVVMGGLTFAIAAGAAGVYVVLSLP